MLMARFNWDYFSSDSRGSWSSSHGGHFEWWSGAKSTISVEKKRKRENPKCIILEYYREFYHCTFLHNFLGREIYTLASKYFYFYPCFDKLLYIKLNFGIFVYVMHLSGWCSCRKSYEYCKKMERHIMDKSRRHGM